MARSHTKLKRKRHQWALKQKRRKERRKAQAKK